LRYFPQLKWLRNNERGAELHELIMGIAAGVSGHETTANMRIELKESGQRLGTIQARHANVEQYQIDLRAILPVHLKGFLTIACLPYRETVLLEPDIQ
jgi:hypothetical protein